MEQGEISASTVWVKLVGKLFIARMELAMNFCGTSLHLGLYICTSRFYASCNLGQELVKLGFDLMNGGARIVSTSTSWHGVHDETIINGT